MITLSIGYLEKTGNPDFIRDIGALAMGASNYEWMRNDDSFIHSYIELPLK